MTHISGQSMPLPWWYSPLEESPTYATQIVPLDFSFMGRARDGEWTVEPNNTAGLTALVNCRFERSDRIDAH